MKIIHSLQTKLTVSFVALILAVTLLTFLITHRETQHALKELTQTELVALAGIVASHMHGAEAGKLAQLKAGDEDSADFLRLRQRLRDMQASHGDIDDIFIVRQTTTGAVQYIVDADHGNEADPGGAIGEAYEDLTSALYRGFTEPSVDEDFFTDHRGTFISGYAPLRDEAGTVIGLVGIEITRDHVLAKQAYLGNTIYIVMAGGILLAGLFILLFSKTIIKDVQSLNSVANKISMGDMEVDIDVRRQDEIGELADSFGRMVASLKLMMMMGKDE